MSDINVISKTQKIIVDAASSTASVINLGPQGPSGVNGKTILNGTVVPAAGTGVDGDFYINTTTKLIYGPKTAGAWGSGTSIVGTGGTYTAYTPTFTGFTLGNGTVTSAFCRVNDFVHYYAEVTLGSTSSVTGPVFVSVPVLVNAGMIASGSDNTAYIYGTASFTDQGTLVNYGWAASSEAAYMRLMVQLTNTTYAQRISMNTTIPFTWVATDTFRFNAYYRAA